MKVSLLVLLSFFTLISYTPRHALVESGHFMLKQDEWNNGYPKERYYQILDLFIQTYNPIIQKLGGSGLFILRDWGDGSVNAWAWRRGLEYHLEVPGGMSRYYLINEEAFVTTICHELGHLLGGAPIRATGSPISFEGQSDYYASARCVKRMLPLISPYKELLPDTELNTFCDHHTNSKICMRALAGAKAVASYFAKIERARFPQLSTESTVVVARTSTQHPKSQCRLDTMKRGFLCPIDITSEVSNTNSTVGYCHQGFHPEFARPACWYKE